MKDTVAKYDEDDEVQTVDESSILHSSSRLNSIEHHLVPVFTSQYLHTTQHCMVTIYSMVIIYSSGTPTEGKNNNNNNININNNNNNSL